MKKAIAAVALTLFSASFALAAGPASITLPAKNGNVTFPHETHQKLGCTKCHATETGGKIADLGKDWAHKTCKGCHAEMSKGPTNCGGCHKK
ncbi:cytochrome c7 [Geomonas sp.]|uniref:cytochrome c7 n=1 Tax=Geomonas sp. TaxID=2651584 RepID=UPI002B47D05C|nr:cytochrome c7 [Geomonas sp.]HJV36459.1 cytochrome c7 [Geomonas sp.]